MIRYPEALTGIADVLLTEVEGGEMRLKLGHVDIGVGVLVEVPVFAPDGFLTCPNIPSDAGATQAYYVREAAGAVCLGFRDNRYAELVGSLEPGDRAIVTDGEARFYLKQKNDAIVLYSVNQKQDLSMFIEVNGKDGTLKLMNGGAWIELKDDKVTIGAGGGKHIMSLSADGISFHGSQFRVDCKYGALGQGLPPAPVPGNPTQGITYGIGAPTPPPSTSWMVAP